MHFQKKGKSSLLLYLPDLKLTYRRSQSRDFSAEGVIQRGNYEYIVSYLVARMLVLSSLTRLRWWDLAQVEVRWPPDLH